MSVVSAEKTSPLKVTPASFGKKLIAWIYDLLGGLAVFILALVIGQLVLYLVTLPWVDDFQKVAESTSTNPIWGLYLLLCVQYFYCWCWVKGGQTLGMSTWRLKLCHEDGSLLSWRQAYLRSLYSLGGVSTLWSLFDQDNRGLQDILTHSWVVQLPKTARKPQQPIL